MTTVTALVRQIIRYCTEEPHLYMWTNKYKNCRTVKCYVHSHEHAEYLTKTIKQILDAGDIEHSTRVIEYNSTSYMSFIVRIPN